MSARAKAGRYAAAALLFAASLAQAGGPLSVCNDAARTPIVYNPPTITLNHDLGNLGARTKAQADAIVTSAVALWTDVGTSTLTFARGADLPVDLTAANYFPYYNSTSDGRNPVIYDTDGTITDALLGVGAHNSVLGFAGSAYALSPTCRYLEGSAVINGSIATSDATLTVTLAHEIGHLVGLDHTQLDATQGLASGAFPLMYPIANRNTPSLHEDDIAAVSALYPDASLAGAYGQISGTFVLADGVTAIRGANLWATQVATGQVYSIVSDYLTQGTGFFRLLLPPGTYNLRAEAIQSNFTGGSSVGPYSEFSADPSFQAPLYVGGVAMAPVTLGNATPTAFTITAGCAATLTFRLDGTGTIGGNCAVPSSMVSPAGGSVLAGASVTFSWTNTGANAYQLLVGTSPGASDLGTFPTAGTTALSTVVSGLPQDGRTVYVRLLSTFGTATVFRDYTYTAFTLPPSPGVMTSPANGGTLTGENQLFTWSGNASAYAVAVGSSVGAYDYGGAYTSANSATVTGLPRDGRPIFVRLYSQVGASVVTSDYTYTAFTDPALNPGTMQSPANGSTFAGPRQVFTWTGNGAAFVLTVGTAPGGYDMGAAIVTTNTATVSGMPVDGRTLYVRLYSLIGTVWYARDYTYHAFSGTLAPAAMLTPPNGGTLAGASQTFTWSDAQAFLYQVWVGTTPGGLDLGYYPPEGTSANSLTVSGLPTDGRAIYVRLYSFFAGTYVYNDYAYTAFQPLGGVISFVTPFTPAQTQVMEGSAAFNIQVSRTGGTVTAGATITCAPASGYAPTLAPLMPSWTGNATGPVQVQVTPGMLPAAVTTPVAVTCTLSNPTGGAVLGASTQYTLTVLKSGGPPAFCTTSADQNFDLVLGTVMPPSAGLVSGRRAYVNALPGTQSAAIRFSPAGGMSGGGGTTISMPSVYGPAPTGNAIEQFVSECPGDFTTAPPDSRFINFNATACGYFDNSQVQFLQFGTSTSTPTWACKLDATKTYYLNFRFRNANGTPSCAGACAVYVDENIN